MAQITRASFKTAKNTRYATNGIGSITGTVTRAHEEDTADSVVFLSDDISTNADFTVAGTKLTDRATIKALFDTPSGFVITDAATTKAALTWTKNQANANQYSELGSVFRNNASAITGATDVVLEVAKIPNNSIIHLDIILLLITIDDSGGAEIRIQASWWKNASGTLAKIVDTIVPNKPGALGDTFTVTTVNSSGDLGVQWSRTGTKSYYGSAFLKNATVITKN